MSVDIHQEKLLILDFGSQYTQLIARRVRELKVYCEIHPFNRSIDFIKKFNPQGIIITPEDLPVSMMTVLPLSLGKS